MSFIAADDVKKGTGQLNNSFLSANELSLNPATGKTAVIEKNAKGVETTADFRDADTVFLLGFRARARGVSYSFYDTPLYPPPRPA